MTLSGTWRPTLITIGELGIRYFKAKKHGYSPEWFNNKVNRLRSQFVQ